MTRYLVSLGCAFLVVMLSTLIIWQDGASWRVPDRRIYPSSSEMRDIESALCNGTDIVDGIVLGGKADQPIITCSHDRQSNENIYVWGDSHSRHLLAGLISNFPSHNIHILYFTSCLAQSGIGTFIYEYKGRTALKNACIARNKQAMQFFQTQKPTSIILHQYFGYEGQFSDAWYASTEKIITELTAHGNKVAFIGAVPRPAVALAECITVPEIIPDWLLSLRCTGDQKTQKKIFLLNIELEKNISDNFLNPNEALCIDENNCHAVENSNLIYRDKHHLTLYGSVKLIDGVRNELFQMLGMN